MDVEHDPEKPRQWWDESLPPAVCALADRLVPLFYEELRRIAHNVRDQFGEGGTLQTTTLVHEAYLRLRDTEDWNNKAHFRRAAALAIRHALIDHALARNAGKRGGGAAHVPLDMALEIGTESDDFLFALDTALVKLAQQAPRLARVVECRYFGGCTDAETAQVLRISERTVRRDWTLAQAWLYRELGGAVAELGAA